MAGMSLSERDLAAIRDVIDACATDDVGPALPWQVMHGLRTLVPCAEMDFSGQDWQVLGHYLDQYVTDDEQFFAASVPEPYDGEGPEHCFWGHFWSDPCSYPERSGDYRSITRLSDWLSERQLHSSRAYSENLRPRGFEHEMMAVWPDGEGRTLRLICWRGEGPDFDERERFLLSLLRPHIAAAYWNAERRRNAPVALSARQMQVLVLVAAGCTNGQIAHRLALSEGTVRTHLNRIFQRLEVNSRTAAVLRAFPDRSTV